VDQDYEIELARALAGGGEEAFERFVEHFRAKLFRYTWLMCRQREDAEEVAQETLLKVFESSDQQPGFVVTAGAAEDQRRTTNIFTSVRRRSQRKGRTAPFRSTPLPVPPGSHPVLRCGTSPDRFSPLCAT